MLKNTLYILLFLACFISAKAQTNLVPNPSFENFINCPTTNGDIYECSSWKTFGNSPDYFNACSSSSGVNVPNAQSGFQYAHSGVAMTGLVNRLTMYYGSLPYREYMGAQLASNLQVGKKYFLSMFINFSGYGYPFKEIAANKTGLRFSTVAYDSTNLPPLNNFAHLYTDSIDMDTVNWFKLTGSFVADSAYKFVAIGNFFDDATTDTLSFGGAPFGSEGAYYYIDDICVTTDSLYNETWTGVQERSYLRSYVNIYPNPTSDFLHIKANDNIEQIQIISSEGQLIRIIEIKSNSFTLSTIEIPNGIYLLKIKMQNNVSNSIINIVH